MANDEWRTPAHIVDRARLVLGSIDVDPASTAKANETVRADVFYDRASDGLEHEWRGRVWLNPPYSRGLVAKFCSKLTQEYAEGNTTEAIALLNASTDTLWFHRMARCSDAICFTLGRIAFVDADDVERKGNNRGQALFYFGDQTNLFRSTFCDIGMVYLHAA